MSLIRRAKISQTLYTARHTASRCRAYSAVATQTRHEHTEQNSIPVAGPSQSDASSADDALLKRLADIKKGDEDLSEHSSRVQSYLASINASGIQPTLMDLERYRPKHRPPTQSPKYAETYNELINTLLRSFTKEQLRQFLLEALGTSRHCSTSRKKLEYAESIMEQLWKWPTLSSIEKARRDRTEVVTRNLPVTASQLFLILGRDGADLLRLSQDHNVHISLMHKPVLALHMEGTSVAVKEVTEHINTLRKTFSNEIFDLPSFVPIPEDMVQRISRVSQAYLENVQSHPGQVRVCAKNAQASEAAKRLASRTIVEIEQSSRTPLLTHLPPGTASHAESPVMYPHVYALYPHLSPRPLPITMNTSGAFRLRRVGDFLSASLPKFDRKDGLAGGQGHILGEAELAINLKDTLLQALPNGIGPSGSFVKASLGHVLLTRVSSQQRATLVPPLTGEHPFVKIRSWIAHNPVKMTFVPDLPLPLLSTTPAGQKMIHRLVFHSLSSDPHSPALIQNDSQSTPVVTRKVISLEITLAELQENVSSDGSRTAAQKMPDETQSTDEEVEESTESSTTIASVRCWTGIQAHVNVIMPDRPMDLRLSVCNSADLSESQQPSELKEYLEKICAFLNGSVSQPEQPMPPLLFESSGEKYLLHSNTSVRQSEETVTDFGLATCKGGGQDKHSGSLTRALCESTLDLENNQKSVHCEVLCEDITSEQSWQRFLADCDRLSIMIYRSPNSMALSGELD